MVDQQIQNTQLLEIAQTFTVPSLFVSAKTGENVEVAFSTLGENLVKADMNG